MTKTLRVGFAGCGEVAVEKHMPALSELRQIEVTAVADVDPARLRYVDKRFGVRIRYGDLDALLADDDLDAIAICLPPALQTEAAIAALDTGKHVWIEPPIALSAHDCDLLIARAERSDKTVIVGFHMRWHRLVRQARQIIDSGRLGTLQTIRAVWNSPRNDDTLHEWRRYRATGGGALVEIAMDHFDLWRYLLQSEIAEMFAIAVNGRWEDEAAVVSGRMSNGVLFSAVLSERASHEIEIEICGKDGRLRVSLIRFEGLEYYETMMMPSAPRARFGRLAHLVKELPRALPRMHRAGDYRTSYRDQWLHFAECIRTGSAVQSTLADGKMALLATLAAEESATSKRPVAVTC